MHQDGHPLGEPLELLVERVDLVRAHAQHGVAVLPDLRERDDLARLALGVALRRLLVVLVHLAGRGRWCS